MTGRRRRAAADRCLLHTVHAGPVALPPKGGTRSARRSWPHSAPSSDLSAASQVAAGAANQARGAGQRPPKRPSAEFLCALRWRERCSAEVVGYLAGDWIEVFAVDAGVYDHNSVVVLERLVDLVEFAGVVDPVASRAERSGQLREVW